MKGPFLQVLGIFAIPSAVLTEMRGKFFYSCSVKIKRKQINEWQRSEQTWEILWRCFGKSSALK